MSTPAGRFRLYDRQQARVLSDRYLESILADWKQTLLLLVQAPVLAALAVVVWDNVGRATASLYFVMTLSAIWLGCIDACREIVKELPLFLRERMVNLDVGAYLVSKLKVLVLLAVVQVVLYTLVVSTQLDVRVPTLLLGLVLLAATVCGTCLGLCISAWVRRSDYAVGLVPLAILPQILFSELAIGEDNFAGASAVIFALMPSRWGYEALVELAATEVDYLHAFARMLPLLGFSLLFVALAWPVLRLRRY